MSNSNYSRKRNDYYNEVDLKELKRKNSPFGGQMTIPQQIPVPCKSYNALIIRLLAYLEMPFQFEEDSP